MRGHLPGALVSSTFYDLRQIRADLASFIESELGYRALLFEDSSPLHMFSAWMSAQMSGVARLIQPLDKLLPYLNSAFGQPGQPGNAKEIVFVAERLGSMYEHLIEWSQRIRRAIVDERCGPVIRELSGFAEEVLQELESLGPTTITRLDQALERVAATNEHQTLQIKLTLRLPSMDGFRSELAKLSEALATSVAH